jgi:hypothetical protein
VGLPGIDRAGQGASPLGTHPVHTRTQNGG